MKSFFTERQWEWIAERFREGYSLKSLAECLGVHRETVRRGLVRIGVKPESREKLQSLNERKKEFYALGDSCDG